MCTKTPLVSVVVPVYNNERYIGQALDSLVTQSLPPDQIEILVVDDGSQDSTASICDNYAGRYPNISIFHQENRGVSAARNYALDRARGKYIAFLDSDDALKPQTLGKAIYFFEQHYHETDAVVLPMVLFNNRKEWPHVREKVLTESGIYDLTKIQYAFALITNVNVIVKNTADLPRFQESLTVHEDELFFMNVLLEKLTVGFSKAGGYRYRQEGESAIYTKMHPYYQFDDNIGFWEDIFARYPQELPLYLQASYLNELNWKLKKDCLFPYHYQGKDYADALSRISKLLDRVDNDIILTAPRSDEYLATYFLSLKSNQQITCDSSRNGLVLVSNNIPILCRKSILAEVCLTKIRKAHWHIEGTLKSPVFSFRGKPELAAQIKNGSGCKTQICAGLSLSSKSMHQAHVVTSTFWDFEIDIPINEDAIISFKLSIDDSPTPLSFAFVNRSSLNSASGITSFCHNSTIIKALPGEPCFSIQTNATKREQRISKRKNDLSVLAKNKKAFILRKIIQIPTKKNRPIWLYYDRTGVGKDNSYYQFVHDFSKNDGIARYYITDNSKEVNERLFTKRQLAFVIPFSSNKHRYLHLKAEKILASYIEHENWRPFHQKGLDSVSDLVNYELIYLQHGVLHAHMPWKYSAGRLLVDKEVISTSYENDVLIGVYGFSSKKLIPSGMPRYDHIACKSSSQRKILYAPSWRKYLVDEVVPLTFTPKYRTFERSSFWKETLHFLNDPLLHKLLEDHGYELDIKLHPIFKDYRQYFDIPHSLINLVDGVTESDYQIFITDYSSWVFDFVYLKRAILYFLPDIEEFRAGLNGYRSLDLPLDQAFGPLTTSGKELVQNLAALIESHGCSLEEYKQRMDGFFFHYDNNQCDRLYSELIKP